MRKEFFTSSTKILTCTCDGTDIGDSNNGDRLYINSRVTKALRLLQQTRIAFQTLASASKKTIKVHLALI
jgi:hypothetical protein